MHSVCLSNLNVVTVANKINIMLNIHDIVLCYCIKVSVIH